MTKAHPKKLGPVLATMFVTGNMVGSGIFLLPATLATIGGISIFTWLLATAGALIIALVFGRLGVIAPWAGGPYAYARATMGRYFGFQTNYIYWISTWVGNVSIALAVTGDVLIMDPALDTPLLRALITSGVIWIMVGANIWGPRIVGAIEASAMLVGLAPILLIGVVGWFYFDPKIFWDSWNVSGQPTIEAVPASLILVFWAFTGLESAAVAVEVIDNPKRNLPIAVVGGVAIAAVIYVMSCTVPMGIVPAKELSASSAPFVLVATKMLGPGVGMVIIATTLLKAAGTHGGWTLVAAATAKAASDDGQFPGVFGRVNSRGIPVQGLLVHGVLMSIAAFATTSEPTMLHQFKKLVNMSVVYSMTSYAYSAFALCRLRPPGTPGWQWDWAKAIGAIVFSLWVIVESDLSILAVALMIMATSIPLYPFYRGGAEPRSRLAATDPA